MRKLNLRKKNNTKQRARTRPAQPQPSGREAVKDSRARRSPVTPDTSRGSERSHLNQKKSVWRQVPLYITVLLIGALLFQSTLIDADNVHVRVAYQNDARDMTSSLEDNVVRAEDYGSTVAAALHDEIRNRSKFTVNTSAIERQLLEQFPELQAAALQLHVFDRSPVLRVVPRTPELIVNSSDEDNSYYVDERGVVIAETEDGGSVDVPVITDEVGLDLVPGSRVLPVETIVFVDRIRRQLESAELSITTMRLPAVANELHVEVEGDGYVGKYDITGGVRQQAGAFIAVRERVIQQNERPDEYIDVRIPGRAYYR